MCFIILLIFFPIISFAQIDKEFWFVAPDISQSHGDRPIYMRISTMDDEANITLNMPANPSFPPITQHISPNTTFSIDLTPWITQIENTPANQVLNKGLKLISDNEVTAYYECANGSNPGIFSLKGKNAVGNEFYIVSQNDYRNQVGEESFDIVATEDNTTVRIVPSDDIIGNVAGKQFEIILNKGQTFSCRAIYTTAEHTLNGSHITSDKPIAVTWQDDSLYESGSYDIVCDQIIPINILGNEYIAISGWANTNERVYVCGTKDHTDIYVNGSGTPITTINSGDLFKYAIPTTENTVYIKASEPIIVLHLSGFNNEFGASILPQDSCTGSDQIGFNRTNNNLFALFLLTRNGNQDSFILNGSSTIITGSDFSVVPGTNNQWVYLKSQFNTFNIPVGPNLISNSIGKFHLGIIHETGASAEYGFFSDFSSLYLGADANMCPGDSIVLDGGSNMTNYEWFKQINGIWTSVGNERYFSVLDSGYYSCVVDGNYCTLMDTIRISLFPNATVDIGPDTSTCEGSTVIFDPGTYSSYLWSTGATTSTISVGNEGYYWVDVINNNGCVATDSAYLTVNPLPSPNIFGSDSVCINSIDNLYFTQSGMFNYLWNVSSGGTINTGIGTDSIYVTWNTIGSQNVSINYIDSNGCTANTPTIFNLTTFQPASAYAGENDTICQGAPYDFALAPSLPDSSSCDSIRWFSSGIGTINNYNALYPVYFPDITEVGDISFTLVAYGLPPCGNDSSTMTLTIDSIPIGSFTLTPADTICVNQDISLNASSTMSISGWDWDFGDGNTSTGQNTTHAYTVGEQFYDIALTMTNQYGCTTTLLDSIFVDSVHADFTMQSNAICFGEDAIFQGTADNMSHSDMEWDFGDGQTAIGMNIQHLYTTPGIYQVTMNVCTDTVRKFITVNSLPQSTFTVSPNDTSCMGEIVTFDATDLTGDITDWQWQFGDGNTGSGQTTTHTYSQQGDMTILSIYTNNNGCIDTTIATRYVMDVNIGFDMQYPKACQNDMFSFTGTGDRVTFTPWNWQFGDGATGTGLDVSHTYTTADTVAVILEVCSEQATQQLVILAPCQVNAGSGDTTCQDVYCDFSNSAIPPTADQFTSVYWYTNGLGYFDDPTKIAPTYFPDPSEGSIQNDTITMMMVGYGNAPCGTDTSYCQLIVIPGAYAQAGSDENSCFGQPYDFNNSTDSAFATNYIDLYWSTSGTGYFVDPHIQRPVYIPGTNEIGPVTLTMIASNIINCDSIDEMILTIRPTYEMPTNITVCYYDSVFAQGAWRYTSGSYYDTLYTATYGCDSVIVTNLTVRPKIDRDFSLNPSDSICYGENVQFTSTGTATLSSWLWEFGDGTTSTDMNPVHQYNTPGYLTIIYHYTDINGCSDSATRQIRVFESPDVSYSLSMVNACVDTEITFLGASNSNIISWDWDFGDGQTGSGQSIAHTYTTWGDMYATLTVTDDRGCTNTYTDLITIAQPPEANFTYAPLICDSIQFTDLSTCSPGYNLVSWQWDFGDGTTDTLQNPAHQYPSNTTPGGDIYMVSVVVAADSLGFICYDSITLPVTVPSLPDIFQYIDPSPTCLGDTTHFFGYSGFPIASWTWDFGDGNTSNDSTTSHLYDTAGTYNVWLYITDTNLCNNSALEQLVVNAAPQASFTKSDSIICQGAPVYFTATGSAGIAQWYWEFGDGGISYSQDPSHYYPSPNTYTVTLAVTDSSGCSTTVTDEILVLSGPVADFSYSLMGCANVAFTDMSTIPTGYNAVQWYWDFGDGSTSTIPNPVHTFNTGMNNYTVSLTVTADSLNYTCSSTISYPVNVPGIPSVYFTWSPEPTVLGDVTSFNGASGSTITDWYWDFGDGQFSSNDQYPAHTYASIGSFAVTLQITDIDGCINTLTDTVHVINTPALDFGWDAACINEPVQFYLNNPPTDIGAISNIQWTFGDGGYSTGFDLTPIHTYLGTGSYSVTCSITDTMGATNTLTKQLDVNPLPISLFMIGTNTCINSPVEFTDLSSTQTGFINQWHWNFGDGSDTTIYFGGNPNVTHSYANSTNYTVTLTVTNSEGCSDSLDLPLSTLEGPIAIFTSSSGCASGPVSFEDQSTENGGGQIVSWAWDFGDPASGTSNTSTQPNPTHLFSAPGNYTVMLFISNINGCEDSTSTTVTVAEEPQVEFTWDDNCVLESTQFTVDGTVTNIGSVQTWNWDFGDGTYSDIQDPAHTYDIAGTFDVTLSITTNDGCYASITHSVTINPLPTANFDHSAPACLNDTINFYNQSSSQNGNIETWLWEFGDGEEVTITAPDDPNVSHTYANGGTFMVTLTVTDVEGCENVVEKPVVVVPSPIADFNFIESCFNQPVQFTDISSTNGGADIGEWEWYFGDPASGVNNNSNIPDPSHIYSSPGTYITTLIVHSTMMCSDTMEKEIIVDSLPNVDFSIESDTLCQGELAYFTGISSSQISSWKWEFGDGGTSILQDPAYGYASPGTYTVTLTVTDVSGCENTVSRQVYVKIPPEAFFEVSGSACLGDSTYFTDLSYSQNGVIIDWQWEFGDGGTSSDPDPVHVYENNLSYYVSLVVTDNNGCSDTLIMPLQVFDKPRPGFSFMQSCEPVGWVSFFNETEPGSDNSPIVNYEWLLEYNNYSTDINPGYIYPVTDTCYTVVLTATNMNGCSASDTNTQVCLFGQIETSFEATQVCLGQPTMFQASYSPQSDSVASYLWNFHDGSQQELIYHDTISHIFPSPGIYTVELIAQDTYGCSATYLSEIFIDSLPVASFTNTIGGCEIPTQFYGVEYSGGEFIESWWWNFGDTTSANNIDSIQDPAHLYGPNDSTYHVELIVMNYNGCYDTIVQDVYVAPCITAGFIVPQEPVCARNEVCFVDTSFLASHNGNISNWNWDFGDGTTESYDEYRDSICHNYANGGTYNVSLEITAGIGADSYTSTTEVEFTVHPTPLPVIIMDNTCYNDTTFFRGNSLTYGEPITTRLWDFGDPSTVNDTAISQDTMYVYPNSGEYEVSLWVQNQFMCKDSITDSIKVFGLPQARFNYRNTCMSYFTEFEGMSMAGDTTINSWFWSFGDSIKMPGDTSVLESPRYVYDSAGSYVVSMVAIDENLCKDTVTTAIEIFEKPTSEFVMIDTIRQGMVYFYNLSYDNPIDYEWDFDYSQGIWTSNDVNPMYQYEQDGNYTVMLVSWNQAGCPDTTYQVYDLLFTNLFVPNAFVPSSPITELQTFKPVGINLKSYRLEIYSAWGNLVFETETLIDGKPAIGWDGTYKDKDLPTGSYIWRIDAVFEDGTIWKGTDNGDGNTGASGSVTLIR